MTYPAISSTASKGGFKLIYARSYRPTLAFACIKRASRFEHDERVTFLERLSRYPGLSATVDKNYWFLAGQRQRTSKDSQVKTADGEGAISIVESSTDEVDEEEVEISTPGGDLKSTVSATDKGTKYKVGRRRRASGGLQDSSSSDSDYGRFGDDFGSAKGRRVKRKRRTSKTTKDGDNSDSSDFFEPNSQVVTGGPPAGVASGSKAAYIATTKWTISSTRKFRLGSQKMSY